MKFKVTVITCKQEAEYLKYIRTLRDEDDTEYAKAYQVEAETTKEAARNIIDRFIAEGGKVVQTEDEYNSYILMPDKRIYRSPSVHVPRNAGFEFDVYPYNVGQLFIYSYNVAQVLGFSEGR